MKTYLSLSFALCVFSFTSCKKEKVKEVFVEDYIVISKEDSITKIYDSINQILRPIIPQEMKWYSDLVFIMDSKNKVFIYQTELISRTESANFDYPNYINLRPEYLTTINSKDFISFLKENNDLFSIFKNKDRTRNFFYIASETDTIKNQALVDLNKALSKEGDGSTYILRKTTEEENIVLKFKRNQQNFEPKNINWSMKFYNGQVKPFTNEYENFRKKINSEVKAKQTFTKKIELLYM